MNNFENNVIPIKKTDRFILTTGKLHQDSFIEEKNQIGYAYLKPTSKTFRLKFWMFPKESFFMSRDNDSENVYTILSMEEFMTPALEPKTVWRVIGKGYVIGNYIRLDFYLFQEEIYLCLFPDLKAESQEVNSAASF